jgi:hypothetical protein
MPKKIRKIRKIRKKYTSVYFFYIDIDIDIDIDSNPLYYPIWNIIVILFKQYFGINHID